MGVARRVRADYCTQMGALSSDPVPHLCATLSESGLDLVHPFALRLYNDPVEPARRLEDFARNDALGLVIGNSRALWTPFVSALRSDPRWLAGPDPLERWLLEQLHAATTCALAAVSHRVYWAHDGPPYLPFQRIAELSGLATPGPAQLSIHPTLGPWFALRAVITVDYPAPRRPLPEPVSPCRTCEQPCVPALARALQQHPLATLTQKEITRSWREWLAVRDACPVGRAHRYSESQIRYHYCKDVESLRQLTR